MTNANTNGSNNSAEDRTAPAYFAGKLENGFSLLESADRSNNKGVQTLAFAAMIGRDQLMQNGKQVASWAAFIGSSEAVNDLATKMLEYADITAPVASKNGKDESFLAADKRFRAQKQAMRRAVVLAADLIASGITPEDFNEKRGLFEVPAASLCEYGFFLATKLARMEREEKPVLLDGSGYYVENAEGKIVAINASVSQFSKAVKSMRQGAIKPTVETAAANTATTGTAKAGEAGNSKAPEAAKWDAMDFSRGVRAIAAIIKDGGDGEPVLWSELTIEEQTALETIRMFIEQAKAAEALAKLAEGNAKTTKAG